MKKILIYILIFLIIGCAHYRNKRPDKEKVLLSKKSETKLGKAASRQVEQEFGIYYSDSLTNYITNIGERIALYSDRPDLEYHFTVLDSFMINAFSLPGGYVYVTRGLLELADNEAELAVVIGHEIGHICAYHAIKKLQNSVLYNIASVFLISSSEYSKYYQTADLAASLVFLGYSREDEYQADFLGTVYASKAGYDPQAMVKFLDELAKATEETKDEQMQILRSHPYSKDREIKLKQDIKKIKTQNDDFYTFNREKFQMMKEKYLYTQREKEFLNYASTFLDKFKEIEYQKIKDYFSVSYRDRYGDLKDFQKRFEKEEKQKDEIIEINLKRIDFKLGEENAKIAYRFLKKIKKNSKYDIDKKIITFNWKLIEKKWKIISIVEK